MRKIRYLVLFFIFFCFSLLADNFSEIFGQVVDSDNKGISGAKIVIDNSIYETSDKWGFFNFKVIPKGIHKINIFYATRLVLNDTIECYTNWNSVVFKIGKKKKEIISKKNNLKKPEIHNVKMAKKSDDTDYWGNPVKKEKKEKLPYFLEDNNKKTLLENNLAHIISGYVKDSITGKSISGAYVKAANKECITDFEGKYSIKIKSSNNEKIKLEIQKPGYKPISMKIILNRKKLTLEHLLEPEGGGVL